MPRRYNIRWKPDDEKQLRNAVRNFNRKVNRLSRHDVSLLDILPARQSVAEIRKDISTRVEYNAYIRSLKAFTKRGAETLVTNKQGVITTKYELAEIRKRVRRINKQRSEQVVIADPSPYRGNMGTISENSLKPKKFDWNKITKRDFPSLKKSVYKQSSFRYFDEKLVALKDNYIKGLYNVFNSDADKIVEILQQIPDEIFRENLYRNPLLTVDFIYDPLESEMKANAIHDNWEKVLNGL